jgi:hypothetical protein
MQLKLRHKTSQPHAKFCMRHSSKTLALTLAHVLPRQEPFFRLWREVERILAARTQACVQVVGFAPKLTHPLEFSSRANK